MFKKIITTFIILSFFVVNAQTFTKHKVAKGETITQIALKYKVTPYDIYRLNPDSQNGLKPETILLIPAAAQNNSAVIPEKNVSKQPVKKVFNSATKTHEVLPKETIYGISKMYGISEKDLTKINPTLETEGLKIGQLLTISGNATPINSPKPIITPKQELKKQVIHEVLPKETKYSIAKKYGTTIAKLEELNPEIVSELPIGFKLIISGKNPNTIVKTPKSEISIPAVKELEPKISKTIDFVNYEVKSKETLYSLSKKFSIKEEDLIANNPELINGLKEGTIIKVPSSTSIKPENQKELSNLLNFKRNSNKKKLAILLPFNINNIEGDTINSHQQRLKKDGFLNMTLDFYSGALVAIDSAKTLGINVDVTILDSQETKTSSNIENLVSVNGLQNYNAIIGPFYQTHCDKMASMMETNNVPVISPLSKEIGKSYKNMYATMPSSEFVKDAMFDFMREKNGNIIAVVDTKKAGIKQYIADNHKDTKFATLDEKGALQTESLKSLLVKDKINYVVMASERTGMIFATTNTLINALPEYQIRLVILEPNETLDFEEIALSRLTKLKLTYPSLSKENESNGAKIFERNFRKKNKIYPNQYAVRGFDITFDTLLRLAQEKTFEETINDFATEQVENKFDYNKRISGGYINKGVYILKYNSDLTISNAE